MAAAEIKEVEETAIAKVSQESMSIYERVKSLQVTDQQSYDAMIELHEASKSVIKSAKAIHDPICDHLNKMHKAATSAREKDLSAAEDAKKLSKSKADTWWMEQERIRLEAERKLQEEARRLAAEQERITREAAEIERKRLAAIEEEERLRLAAEAEAQGATKEQVTQILDVPLPIPEPAPYVPPPVVMPTLPPAFKKAEGFSARWNYSGLGVDIMSLVKAAVTNPYFAGFLQFNESAINALARAQKDAFQLPGCQLKKVRV